MADIANSAIFTNDSVSTGTTDLLQQAFQQVINDDNNENDFVNFLQNNVNGTNTITITPDQASAFGLSFEIDNNEDVKVWDSQNKNISNNEVESDTQNEADISMGHLDIKPQIVSPQMINVLSGCDLQNWTVQNVEQAQIDNIKSQKKNDNILFGNACYAIDKNKINAIPASRAQILLKTTNSNFVVKPQNITKNVRILPNTSKVDNNIQRQFEANTNQGPILFPKGTLINTLPSIIRAIPVSTLQLNINPQVTQEAEILQDGSKIFTSSLDESLNGKTILNSNSETQMILPQIVMTTQEVQNRNAQSFIAPVIKNTNNGTPILKTGRISTMKTDLSKPIQIAPKIISSIPSATINNTESLIAKNSKVPIIFRPTSMLKSNDRIGHSINRGNSMSILKPAGKALNGIVMQGGGNTSKGTINNSSSNFSSSITKPINTTANKQIGRVLNITNSVPSPALKQKVGTNNVNAFTVAGNNKNDFVSIQNAGNATKSVNINKAGVNSEQPIQIIQQGQTFQSMQQLTQAQLKQIVTVLQQKNQDSFDSNEKIVYRVVFPEELDLRIRSPGNIIKNRISKRGRPKKGISRNNVPSNKQVHADDHDDAKNERKKVVARTRSGRLSRPPRHMVRDYKHLHHLDFMQPDLDDSDGGYSDYNTHSDKLDDDESPKELLTGLEVPKRKISDHFRCPTCNKIYLGRTRMSRHFEAHPDHGSPAQLPPPTPVPELKQISTHDPLKRKGKKRGPWAYVTPEAKSERRQVKLKEAISVCDNTEILKIAAKPVVNAQSLYNLLVLKSDNNIKTFFNEMKNLLEEISNVGSLLSAISEDHKMSDDVVEISDKNVCDALGINPGFYKLNGNIFDQEEEEESIFSKADDEPIHKMAKLNNFEDGKENIDEQQMSPEFSEHSELGVSNFLHKRNAELNCPEVLTALTLMPRNPIPEDPIDCKSSAMSTLLISNPEIQSQISDSSGFQKIDINTSQDTSFQKYDRIKDEVFSETTNCTDVFAKLNYDRNVKLESMEQGFVKLDVSPYQNKITPGFEKMEEDESTEKLLSTTSACKVSDIMQETAQIITSTCDSNIFGNSEPFDVSKLHNYDHITHLDILNISGVIDKNLMIDDKLVEHLNLVDQSNIVDELVSERLKTIIPDNILEGNIISNHSNTMIPESDLDFTSLSEEFNGNKS